MIISENIFAMLLTEDRFKDFTKKDICDAHKNSRVLVAIDADCRIKVVEMVKIIWAAGGSTHMKPHYHGWMFVHNFTDLDGHQLEIIIKDRMAIPK